MPLKTETVLIIDDDPTVLQVTEQILRRFGYETETALSGFGGLEILEDRMEEIHCVLLDMSMPGMDGAETFRELRRLRPGLPVVMISGFAEDDLATSFPGDAPFAFVQKPFSIGDLDHTVRSAIAQLRPRRPRRPAPAIGLRAPIAAV